MTTPWCGPHPAKEADLAAKLLTAGSCVAGIGMATIALTCPSNPMTKATRRTAARISWLMRVPITPGIARFKPGAAAVGGSYPSGHSPSR